MLNTGLNEIRNWLAGNTATPPTYLNIGDDNTAPVETDTALLNELLRNTFSSTELSDREVVFTYVLDSSTLNGETLKEVGVNSASSSGVQFTRSVHSLINKTSSIEVQYRVRLRLTSGGVI